jgi:hypothetical protein
MDTTGPVVRVWLSVPRPSRTKKASEADNTEANVLLKSLLMMTPCSLSLSGRVILAMLDVACW